MLRFLVLIPAIFSLAVGLLAQEHAGTRKLQDIPYARVDGQELRLDLYLPATAAAQPLVVFVHGGAWRSGSKDRMPLTGLLEAGFAAASVDYRLSPVARFPAQVHDVKAAIRFLRAKAGAYGYNASRIVIAGTSAGAHLAALVGVTNGNEELEGAVGDHLGRSSEVQAIVSYFGASNLLTILSQSTPRGLSVRRPALELLLGARPEQAPALARLASPVFHVDASDPPLLLLHGDQDAQMPVNQSLELLGRYEELGLRVRFEVVRGAGHGGRIFFDAERDALVRSFLSEALETGETSALRPFSRRTGLQ